MFGMLHIFIKREKRGKREKYRKGREKETRKRVWSIV
jgi:hypothetical protein